MDYPKLLTFVAETLNRDDLTGAIPSWVTLCEEDLNKRLRVPEMEAYAVVGVTDGVARLPSEFQALLNIELADDPQIMTGVSRTEFDGLTDHGGGAIRYTIQGRNLLFFPAPTDQNVQIRLHAKLLELSTTVPTNEIIEAYPTLYLYGTLIHSAPYLGEDERLIAWQSLYERALLSANEAAKKLMAVARPQMKPNARIAQGHVT